MALSESMSLARSIAALACLGVLAAGGAAAYRRWGVEPPQAVAERPSRLGADGGADEVGSLSLRVLPVASAVYIDGEFVAFSDPDADVKITANPGLRELLVQRTGYHDHVSTLLFAAGSASGATVTMTPQRRHVPRDGAPRDLRPEGAVRGAISSGDRSLVDVLKSLGVAAPAKADELLAVELRLKGLTARKYEAATHSREHKLALRIVEVGVGVVAESLGEAWNPKLSFEPKPGATYVAVVSHSVVDRASALELVRFTALLRNIDG